MSPETGQRGTNLLGTIARVAETLWRERRWELGAAAILFVGALIRFCYLTIAPLHHDEGVNGNFLVLLYRTGAYQYDPQNYHGPSLYYIALLVARLFGLFSGHEGLTTLAIKIVPAVFGIALVWLALQLRRELGDVGALATATLAAISPGAVYFSRYFIHEILFVFFSLGTIVALLFYARTMKPLYLMLLSASLALLVATKETSVITIAVLVLSYICIALLERLRRKKPKHEPQRNRKGRSRPVPETRAVTGDFPILNPATGIARWAERAGGWRQWRSQVFAAAGLFLVIHVCLFSSFFGLATAIKIDKAELQAHHWRAAVGFDSKEVPKHLEGVLDSVLTYETWTKTAETGYVAPADQYLTWMGRIELGTLLLGAAGIVLALGNGRNRFAVFAAFYALGELSAYSLIPYKTPWLALNILLPFWLAAGYAVKVILDAVRSSSLQRDKIAAWVGLAVVVVSTTWQSVDLSYFRYDDDSLPYVYAHTRRTFLDMTNEIDRVVQLNQLGSTVGITVMAPEHWPLPWYTRYYPNSGYWGKVVRTHEAIIVGQDRQRQEIEKTVGARYDLVGTYPMRPGVVLDLYIRKGLAR